MSFGEATGQGWTQIAELGLALVLSALIGLEREVRQKSAGLRTYTLVGLASALVVLVSKYGFTDVLAGGRIVLDPARVAAQVVSGIGFIGGGLIFVRKDSVRGLTTAAGIWLTAAVGMACGTGLPILAAVVTLGHLFVVLLLPWLIRKIGVTKLQQAVIDVSYRTDAMVLDGVLRACRNEGFVVTSIRTAGDPSRAEASGLSLEIEGSRPLRLLLASVSEIEGVIGIQAGEVDNLAE